MVALKSLEPLLVEGGREAIDGDLCFLFLVFVTVSGGRERSRGGGGAATRRISCSSDILGDLQRPVVVLAPFS